MTPAEMIAMVGEALYGPRWQTPLAADLAVSDRTMRRWAAGTDVPRAAIVSELMSLVLTRADTLRRLEARLADAPLDGFRAASARAA